MNLPEWLRVGLELAGSVGGIVTAAAVVTVWAMSRALVSKDHFTAWRDGHEKEHEALSVRLAKGDEKFTAISADARHQPNYGVIEALRADIGRLEASLREVAASERGMRERFLAIEGQLDRVIGHLLQNGGSHE